MRYVVIVMLFLTGLDLALAQEESSPARESLRGLSGVSVLVGQLAPDVKADGLSEEAIRTAVQQIIRSNGIRALSQADTKATGTGATLLVRANTMKPNTQQLYVYDVSVQFYQRVVLVNQPDYSMLAMTWESGVTGAVGSGRVRDFLNSVERQVKAFANDFLTVNPR